MGQFKDLTGKRFGRLTVLRRDFPDGKTGTFWLCLCDCGNMKSVSAGNLHSGWTKSCGCYKAETSAAHFFSQDDTRKNNLRLYSIHKSMKQRCLNEKHKCYKNYGGRGITICESWLGENGFKNFVLWAKSNGYKDGLTIDRVDTNGNYCPENCRWVTMKENANNKSDNRYIEYNGEVKTMSQWADYCGISQTELKRRLDYLNLPIEAAVSYKGLPMANYHGEKKSVRRLAQMHGIDYKVFLHEFLVENKSAEEIINEHDDQTRQSIKRMLDQM